MPTTPIYQTPVVPDNAVYYPSLVINLRLRFDEALSVNENLPAPNSVDGLASANTPTIGPAPPLVFGGDVDQLSQVLGIVPKQCSVELPAYRQAGTFALDMDFRDLPLDPRVVRACGIEVHLGAVQAPDFGTGMTANRVNNAGQAPVPRRTSVINTRDAAGNINSETLLLVGTVDDITVEHTETGSMIHMEGRDLRGILLDTQITSGVLAKLQLNYGIDIVVEQIMNFNPLLRDQIIIDVDPTEWPDGVVPSPGVAGNLTRVLQGANGQAPQLQVQGDPQKLSFWDIITQYCFLVGAVPYFVGEHLRIRPARSLFDQRLNDVSFNPLVPTPFANGLPRTIQTGSGASQKSNTIKHRYMVYGRDISHLKFERKLAGTKVPAVETVCVDTGNKKLLTAIWPTPAAGVNQAKLNASKITTVSPSGGATQEDILRIPVHGIKNKAQLLRIARDIREEIGRGEIGGSISTKNLASFGGGNADPDLLRLRVGDAVELVVDASTLGSTPPVVSELNTQNSRSFEQQVKALTKRIGDANLARVLTAVSRGSVQELQRIFRIANIKYGWDAATGVSIDFDFQNYVEVRYDVTAPGPTVQAGSGASVPPSTAVKKSNVAGPSTQPATAPVGHGASGSFENTGGASGSFGGNGASGSF